MLLATRPIAIRQQNFSQPLRPLLLPNADLTGDLKRTTFRIGGEPYKAGDLFIATSLGKMVSINEVTDNTFSRRIVDLTAEDMAGHEPYDSLDDLIEVFSGYYPDYNVVIDTIIDITRFRALGFYSYGPAGVPAYIEVEEAPLAAN